MSRHPIPTLSIRCVTGLSNRLSALTSGRALAEASGRAFQMLWPRTSSCGATFAELFSNEWGVSEAISRGNAPARFSPMRRSVDVLNDPTPEIHIDCVGSLLDPSRFRRHAALAQRDVELLQQLKPVTALAHAIDEFRARHFRAAMIGVHLRRGDFVRFHGDTVNNTKQAMAAIDKLLARTPEAGIFLCSDDGAATYWGGTDLPSEGVHKKFQVRYGSRVVWRPASLDRRQSAAIQDALIDLWLLRQTTAFVGSRASSFSRLVLHGRSVPSVLCRGYNLKYAVAESLCRATGIYFLMRYHCQKRHGSAVSFPVMGQYYKTRLLQAFTRKGAK